MVSDQLLKKDSFEFTKLTIERCPQVFSFVRHDHICTSGVNYTSEYFGDSAGPLSGIDEKGPVLIGIASFVQRGKSIPQRMTFFTRVDKYLDWIKAKTGLR